MTLSSLVLKVFSDEGTGQTIPVFQQPHSKHHLFLMFKWNFPCFSMCPLPLVFSLSTENIPSVFFTPSSIKNLQMLMSPLTLLSWRLNTPSSLSVLMQIVYIRSPSHQIFFPNVQMGYPMFQFVIFCLLSSHWKILRSLLLRLTFPIRCLYTLLRTCSSKAKQPQFSQPLLI